jgi:hypothetical protein
LGGDLHTRNPRLRTAKSGGRNRGVDEDIRASGDEGARNAQATPPIAAGMA